MGVTPANRDRLREQAFAMNAQGIGVREIAARLGINKDTAAKLVREERARRSHDRDAEDAIRDAIASLRHLLIDLHQRYDRIEGEGAHAAYARERTAETIRRMWRDLIGMYNVVLPETDPERIIFERMMSETASGFPDNPGGYPAVGEQAVMDRYAEELDDQLVDLGVIASDQATRKPTPERGDSEFWYDGAGEPGDPYDVESSY